MKSKVEVVCDHCGKRFERKACKVEEHNFCCRECYWSFKRRNQIVTVCERCGKEIRKPPSKKTERNFCSRSCHMKTMNEEMNPTRMTDEVKEKLSAVKMKPERKGYKKVHGVHEHRTIAEQALGRPLRENEVVHHIDSNKANNAPSNLMVFPSQAEHAKWHAKHDGGVIGGDAR